MPNISNVVSINTKKKKSRKISPFSVVLFLFVTAIISVLYISNKLAINRLMSQINQMEARHQEILNYHEMLKARINKLCSLDRIQKVAAEQLGLKSNKQLPVWLEIDFDREEIIRKSVDEQYEKSKY